MNKPLALCFLCVLIVLAGCKRPIPKSDPPPIQNSTEAREQRLTESSWIIRSIVRDLADMTAFVGDWKQVPVPEAAIKVQPLPRDAAGYHYKVTLEAPCKLVLQIDLPGSIWDSAAYQPAAAALLAAYRLSPQAMDQTSLPDTPLKMLTSPRAYLIQRENQRVAATLNEHPLSAEAHEQAALVVAVLGLRENSGALWDPRAMNNRATAHLALAGALRGGSLSEAGEIAELLTGLEADTKKDCAERIERLQARVSEAPLLAPWLMAAGLRNTRDWRLLKDPARATLLERIEFFRAQCEAVSTDAAAKQLLAGKPEPITDWANIVLQLNFSVENGHVFTANALGLELQEISEVFPASREAKLSPQVLAQFINKEPRGAVTLDGQGVPTMLPIDEGMWAHYFQRHLCHIANRTDVFLRDKWGVPEKAQVFETGISNLCAQLTFAPLLHVLWNRAGHEDLSGMEAAAELTKAHPEWVTECVWKEVRRPGVLKTLQEWYNPGLPPGTAYCYVGRSQCVTTVKRMAPDDLRRLHELAPWQFGVTFDYLKALHGQNPSPEQARSVFGPFLDFYLPALSWCAHYSKANPGEYIDTCERMAQWDPGYYLRLAEYCHEHQMDERGVQAMEQAGAHEADSVWLANTCGWVVDYYFDHGNRDRALALAKFAAEVYSFSGLATMGRLQERLGDLKAAETYFDKIKDRYDDAAPLIAFYKRQSERDPGSPYAAKFNDNIGSVFPEGLKPADLATFTAPPQKGVMIAEQNERLRQCGLSKGDIIVALDGIRVGSFPQYSLVRDFTTSPHMELIVFRNGQYQLVKAELPERRFGVDFRSWP